MEQSPLFTKYIWLLDTIIGHPSGITLEGIQDKWASSSLYANKPLPRKSFTNYKSAIKSIFDIDIACDRRTNKYYVEYPEDLERSKAMSWMIQAISMKVLVDDSRQLKGRIIIEDTPAGQQYLKPIVEAMNDNRIVSLLYHKGYANIPIEYEIEPYFLKSFRQRWYVIGKRLDKDKIWISALDRIERLIVSEEKFNMPKDFCGEELFADSFGIIMESDVKPQL